MRYLLLAMVLVLTACQTARHGTAPEKLVHRTQGFEDVVRWGALQKMVVFTKIDPDKPVTIPAGLDNVRVTGYELASGLTEVTPTRWRQTAVIDYVLTDRQIVRQLIDHQIWASDDDGKSWYRENPLPQFN